MKLFRNLKIHLICKGYRIKNYIINEDGSIDVNGDVNLIGKRLKRLPLKFRNVSGNFDCSKNRLVSLEGSPEFVGGAFFCNYNNLTSLKGGPKKVYNIFNCSYNNIITFEGAPDYLKVNRESFMCYSNPIYNIWNMFRDYSKIELLNDYDMFRENYNSKPGIIIDRLNNFLVDIHKTKIKTLWQPPFQIHRKNIEKKYRNIRGYINI